METAEAKGKSCGGCGEFYRDIHGHFDRDGRTADGYKAMCRTCESIAKRAKGARRRGPAALRAAQAGDRLVVDFPSGDGGGMVVTLDLTDFPGISGAIAREAAKEFRTPEMQVLYWLVKTVAAETEAA